MRNQTTTNKLLKLAETAGKKYRIELVQISDTLANIYEYTNNKNAGGCFNYPIQAAYTRFDDIVNMSRELDNINYIVTNVTEAKALTINDIDLKSISA